MFVSQLWHEPLSAENSTVKIVSFYEGNKSMRKIVDAERITIDRQWKTNGNTIEDNSKSAKV